MVLRHHETELSPPLRLRKGRQAGFVSVRMAAAVFDAACFGKNGGEAGR